MGLKGQNRSQRPVWLLKPGCRCWTPMFASHFQCLDLQSVSCLQAARAPLLVAVLQGYRSICGEAWQTELRSVFPHLTHLICSAQPSVRSALADLLQAQIPKMIT